ncbi:MAG: hypothetical protein FJ137_04085 [Deltaproteobacteria bacterium]|nr:hypothetical protein [Deltaproteobacteria bacterium]
MSTITRQQFLQTFQNGIDLNGSNAASLDPTALSRLKALDTNGDGIIRGSSSLQQAWRILDGFDRNGDAASVSSAGRAGNMVQSLKPAGPRESAPAGGVTPQSNVSVSTSERIAKGAADRVAADGPNYAWDKAPTSPYRNLTSNRVPGESRPSWLKNNNKCNQFVGDALTAAGVKMPTFKMQDGSEHYMNAEKLPAQSKFFDRITDPQQIRPGDVFVLDYPGQGESTAHTEVITGFDKATGNMKTTGAHSDGAYEMDRGAWLKSFTYDTARKCWTNSSGQDLYILRPKQLADAAPRPIRA